MDVAADKIETLFKSDGALLLRGFDLDVGTFRQFAERICETSAFNESPNRAVLDAESQIQSVDLGSEPFPLHPELSREPWRPDICLFACLEAPTHGGQTTVCDGVELVRQLPPELVAAMLPRSIFYFQLASPDALEFWLGTPKPTSAQLQHPPKECPYFFIEDGDRVIRGFGRPLLQKPFFSDEPAFANFLLFARDYRKVDNFPVLEDGSSVPGEWMAAVRDTAAEITYDVSWQVGDILILDNSRFMHGRRAITDPSSRTIASYFGYASFTPRQAVEPAEPLWRRGNFKPPLQRTDG
jgi:alpha-ketoglutarate-dependent taurine dioxygenase